MVTMMNNFYIKYYAMQIRISLLYRVLFFYAGL